jgi:hypothetical protein
VLIPEFARLELTVLLGHGDAHNAGGADGRILAVAIIT